MHVDGKSDPFREGSLFEHEELPWYSVVLGVLRGKNFGSMNRHGHCSQNPVDAVAVPPDISLQRKPNCSGKSRRPNGRQPNASPVVTTKHLDIIPSIGHI